MNTEALLKGCPMDTEGLLYRVFHEYRKFSIQCPMNTEVLLYRVFHEY